MSASAACTARVYWTDPGLERDPSKWRTEILQPVLPQPGAMKPGTTPGPDAEVRQLDLLVGTWRVHGEAGGAHGTVSFEWLEGGYFLLQRVDLVHDDAHIQGLEVIGRERPYGADQASGDIRSRSYDSQGNTIENTWELVDRRLTIWAGERGSAVSYEGTFSQDGNALTGAWTWPGGGYESTSTRVVEPSATPQRRP